MKEMESCILSIYVTIYSVILRLKVPGSNLYSVTWVRCVNLHEMTAAHAPNKHCSRKIISSKCCINTCFLAKKMIFTFGGSLTLIMTVYDPFHKNTPFRFLIWSKQGLSECFHWSFLLMITAKIWNNCQLLIICASYSNIPVILQTFTTNSNIYCLHFLDQLQ